MIKLGFVSAILGQNTFEEVITFAAKHDFQCVEVLCEPAGKTDRKYGGIAHIDVESLTAPKAQQINAYAREHKVQLSALAYYQNTMHEDELSSMDVSVWPRRSTRTPCMKTRPSRKPLSRTCSK
jgi:sugar phosphate isomerase/epimerase